MAFCRSELHLQAGAVCMNPNLAEYPMRTRRSDAVREGATVLPGSPVALLAGRPANTPLQ